MNTAVESTARLIVPVPEGRRMLGDISVSKIYGLMKHGELVRVHVGRRAFITRASIEAYVDRLQHAGM